MRMVYALYGMGIVYNIYMYGMCVYLQYMYMIYVMYLCIFFYLSKVYSSNFGRVSIIDREPVGVRVAENRKNFRLLDLTIHTSEIMETKVCRVPGGGCDHEAYETGLKNGLGQLWNRKI